MWVFYHYNCLSCCSSSFSTFLFDSFIKPTFAWKSWKVFNDLLTSLSIFSISHRAYLQLRSSTCKVGICKKYLCFLCHLVKVSNDWVIALMVDKFRSTVISSQKAHATSLLWPIMMLLLMPRVVHCHSKSKNVKLSVLIRVWNVKVHY